MCLAEIGSDGLSGVKSALEVDVCPFMACTKGEELIYTWRYIRSFLGGTCSLTVVPKRGQSSNEGRVCSGEQGQECRVLAWPPLKPPPPAPRRSLGEMHHSRRGGRIRGRSRQMEILHRFFVLFFSKT